MPAYTMQHTEHPHMVVSGLWSRSLCNVWKWRAPGMKARQRTGCGR